MKLLTPVLRLLTIKKLVVLSVLFTLLPMLAGLVSAFFAVERLSSLSQAAVHHVATEAMNGQELLDQLNDLERRGRSYLNLRDVNTFGDFKLIHEHFNQRLRRFIDMAKTENSPLTIELEALAADETLAFESIVSRFPVRQLVLPKGKKAAVPNEPFANDNPPDADHFQSVKAKARDLSFGYASHIEQEAKNLETLSRKTKRSLAIYIVLLVSMCCFVVLVVVYLLHHPIRQIDFCIRTLGAGNFTQPISISGTGDVVFLGERLEWLRTHLNDLEMAKQRFVRNVSHEIKTPLATIHEGAELLVDEVVGGLNREQKDIAEILVNNADRMDKMIAELITYSQVSAHRARQRLDLVNMRQMVFGLLEDYRLQLRGRSITVTESIETVEIMGDKEQLRTIVDNLLSNAVKYSPEGGEIRLSLAREGGQMVLEIEDEGPGIDPDEREKVFEPFFQGRSSRALGVKGSGFGLAIVAECVASHQGTIVVLDSQEDYGGAHIMLKLPMKSLTFRQSEEDSGQYST